MRKLTHSALLLALALCVTGCNEDAPRFEADRAVLKTPIALGENLVLVDQVLAQAHVLNATDATAPTRVIQVLPEPIMIQTRNEHPGDALVLSTGRLGDENTTEAEGGLSVIGVNGLKEVHPTSSNPFGYLIQQPNGRHVALLRDGTGQFLENRNELAFVELDDSSEESVRLVNLPEPAYDVVFSENFSLGERDHELAVVLMPNYLAIVDLEARDAGVVTIQLNSESTGSVLPRKVLFDSENARLYVLSDVDDIFTLRLAPRESEDLKVDFSVSVDIVAAGQKPSDLDLFKLEDVTYLFVVAKGSQTATVVDVATSRTVSLSLPNSYDSAHIYYADDSQQLPYALFWESRAGNLGRVELSLSSVAMERSIEALPGLPGAVETVFDEDENRLAFVSTSSSSSITLVNPRLGSVTPYRARLPINSGIFDQDSLRLWFAPLGRKTVGLLDIDSGETSEFLLDSEVAGAVLIPEAKRFAVIHRNGLGHVTFVDTESPSRNTAVSKRGFLVEGYFE